MAVTQSDLDALDAAIASGVRMVTIGGQTTTFQTTESLAAARDRLSRQLQAAQAGEAGKRLPPTRSRLTYGGRGY